MNSSLAPLILERCYSDNPESYTTQYLLQLDHGALKRINPPTDTYRMMQAVVVAAMRQFLDHEDSSPDGCGVHCYDRTPVQVSLRKWWHRRLLQHTPYLLAEVVGRSVILTYKDVAIILSQAAIKGLHREFVTHMQTPQVRPGL